MKQIKSILFVLMMIAVLIIGTAAVNAQGTALPAYTITSVTSGTAVTVQTKDFPAGVDFVVQMGDSANIGSVYNVAKFNSGNGGVFNLNLPIPAELKSVANIDLSILSVADPSGLSITSSFANQGFGNTVSCDYSRIPTFSYDVIRKNNSITVTTKGFPANSRFRVRMGITIAGSVTRWGIRGYETDTLPQPYYDGRMEPIAGAFNFTYNDPANFGYNFPDPVVPPCWPTGQDCVYSVQTLKTGGPASFWGYEVGTYDSGDGSPQTVSYDIPVELLDYPAIVVRFDDLGPCGIYTFNYFWNNDYPVSGDVPTIEITPIQ